MGDLYSAQTFLAARDHLDEGGVLATWFHVYSTDLEIVRSIAATFASVFPEPTLWELVRGQDYLLVGRKPVAGEEPLALDLDRLAARAADPEVADRFRRAGIESVPGLLARLVAFGDGAHALGEGAPILSSRDGSLEARAARSLYRDASLEALVAFADLPRRPGSLRVRARTEEGGALAAALPAAVEAGALGRTLVLHAAAGEEAEAIAAGERAIGLLPDDPSLRDALATLYLARGKTHALVREDAVARDALLTVLELEPGARIRSDALTTLGDLHLRAGEPEAALVRYQTARRLSPTIVELTERIADCLEAVGAEADAARERRLAARLRRAQM
jgi:tetratricopeptide (TPR) repeat protein